MYDQTMQAFHEVEWCADDAHIITGQDDARHRNIGSVQGFEYAVFAQHIVRSWQQRPARWTAQYPFLATAPNEKRLIGVPATHVLDAQGHIVCMLGRNAPGEILT